MSEIQEEAYTKACEEIERLKVQNMALKDNQCGQDVYNDMVAAIGQVREERAQDKALLERAAQALEFWLSGEAPLEERYDEQLSKDKALIAQLRHAAHPPIALSGSSALAAEIAGLKTLCARAADALDPFMGPKQECNQGLVQELRKAV